MTLLRPAYLLTYTHLVIPTIMGLKRKLEIVSEDVNMRPLTTALLSGIQNRFQSTLDSDECRIATMLHPKFKLAFLRDEQARMQGRQFLLTYITSSARGSGTISFNGRKCIERI